MDVDKAINIQDCTPNTRVALRNDSYTLHKILPTKVQSRGGGEMEAENVDDMRMEHLLPLFFLPGRSFGELDEGGEGPRLYL